MWKRFAKCLRCVECGLPLEMIALKERRADLKAGALARAETLGIRAEEAAAAIDAGLLICRDCATWNPVFRGLPVLLPFSTTLHAEFRREHESAICRLGPRFRAPRGKPARGEEFVMRSFSREWLDYSFDGVLWIWSYEDRERLFLAEIGRDLRPPVPFRFLEIGCGIGVVTAMAAKHCPGDAVGVDLSLAPLRAVERFRANPFVHCVQASLWRLPFTPASFDLVYSHGVLHHTHSTKEAFRRAAAMCREGGRLYVWLYGRGSITDSLARRAAYAVECLLRPVLARTPASLTNAALAPIAVAYMAGNAWHRATGSPRRAYDFRRAFHAARDRFTPLFADRVSPDDVRAWFHDAGFGDLHAVRPDEVPPAASDTIRRNVGLRGVRKSIRKS